MHRIIAIAILLFWAVMFGGLAHVSLTGFLLGLSGTGTDLQFLLTTSGGHQIMPVMLMIVSALFGWAILALATTDYDTFREVEEYAYATAIIVMCACAALAFAKFSAIAAMPAVFTAALSACIAASKQLNLRNDADFEINSSREFARQMAISAAHNSLLSRLSGRNLHGQAQNSSKIALFPVKLRSDQPNPRGTI